MVTDWREPALIPAMLWLQKRFSSVAGLGLLPPSILWRQEKPEERMDLPYCDGPAGIDETYVAILSQSAAQLVVDSFDRRGRTWDPSEKVWVKETYFDNWGFGVVSFHCEGESRSKGFDSLTQALEHVAKNYPQSSGYLNPFLVPSDVTRVAIVCVV